MVAKDGRFYLRLTDEDRELFDEVSRGLGSSNVSEAVRFVMREKHRELYGVQPLPKRPPPRKRSK
jgi:hypothetical protein